MNERALFLDRDGTIMADVGYPSDPRQVHLLPNAAEGLKVLQERNYALVVVSNQSGIARGRLTLEDAQRVNAELERQLRQRADVRIDAFYLCPHLDRDGCDCRKPKPGLIERAIAEHHYDRTGSVAVGDRPRDIAAGRAAELRTVRIVGGPHADERGVAADYDAEDLLDAARWIIAGEGNGAQQGDARAAS
ncbi:HAD family hydrolase [bacterium]|nr:MAG: HAD family hydrolase [bacterium]